MSQPPKVISYKSSRISSAFTMGMILCIFAFACSLRFFWINWDAGLHLHPDERFLTIVSSSVSLPDNLIDYFDSASSSLNPRNQGHSLYVYGDFPLLLIRFVSESLSTICAGHSFDFCYIQNSGQPNPQLIQWTDYNHIHLIGRLLSAVANIGTLIWLFLLTRQVFGRQEALTALALGASCTLFIQQSHFFTVDSLALCFATAGLFYYCQSARQCRSKYTYLILAGVMTGFAIACRINLAPMMALGSIAAIGVNSNRYPMDRWITRTLVIIVATALTFRLAMPNIFSSWFLFDQRWLLNIRALISLGPENLYPPSVQWTNRTPWLFTLNNMLFWGLGLGLGISAFFGWLTSAFRMWILRAEIFRFSAKADQSNQLQVLILWVFITAYCIWVGNWANPTMRYLLPVYPPLIVLAGWWLVRIWNNNYAFPVKIILRLLVTSLFSFSILWAIAFISIYRDINPRIAAAQWVNSDVADGSVMGFETWDDSLQLDKAKNFTELNFNHYAEDRENKRFNLYSWLDQVDYIVLTSNRIHASIPRQPLRYPLTSNYYKLLFSGELGFKPVAEFSSYPRLFSLVFPDQELGFSKLSYVGISNPNLSQLTTIKFPPADEAFSVYDHPRVLIFKKEDTFSPSLVIQKLQKTDLHTGLQTLSPAAESEASSALMFSPDEFTKITESGTWSKLFNRGSWINENPLISAIMVYLLINLMSWFTWPISYRIFSGLEDRGIGLNKIASVFMSAGGIWYLASLKIASFNVKTIVIWLALLSCLSFISAWPIKKALAKFISAKTKTILVTEIIFASMFFFVLILRWWNPDLWHQWFGGEKPMDFAFLNATLKSNYFPPHDPFFSGGYINYYYFGFVLAALPIKLLGIVPDVGYQIALALFFALAAMGVFSVTVGLASESRRPISTAVFAVLLVLLIGNLAEFMLLASNLLDFWLTQSWVVNFTDASWFWNATRIIPSANGDANLITEFPFFTVLYGDLHAHFMTLPLTVLSIGLCLSWWRIPPTAIFFKLPKFDSVVSILFGGCLVGSLFMSNTWDFPTYGSLAFVTLVGSVFSRKIEKKYRITIICVALFAATVLLFTQPFRNNFATGYSTFSLWHGSKTPLSSYFIVHGIFLFPILSLFWIKRRIYFSEFLFSFLRMFSATPNSLSVKVFFALVSLLFIAFSWYSTPVMLIALPIILLSLGMILNPKLSRNERAWAALTGLAACITLLVEWVTLTSDSGRVNMVFKFYYQVWVLWGICAAVACMEIWAGHRLVHAKKLWQSTMVILVLAGSCYTIFAPSSRLHYQMDPARPNSLNGSDFMRQATHNENGQSFSLIWDYEAIHWIQNNIQGTPVIAEGRSAHEYLWGNRIAIHTGLPAVIGWRYHVSQSRSILPNEVVDIREQDLHRFFDSTNIYDANNFIRRYMVGLIYIGPLEEIYYSREGLEKFKAMEALGLIEKVYKNPKVDIYKVR